MVAAAAAAVLIANLHGSQVLARHAAARSRHTHTCLAMYTASQRGNPEASLVSKREVGDAGVLTGATEHVTRVRQLLRGKHGCGATVPACATSRILLGPCAHAACRSPPARAVSCQLLMFLPTLLWHDEHVPISVCQAAALHAGVGCVQVDGVASLLLSTAVRVYTANI